MANLGFSPLSVILGVIYSKDHNNKQQFYRKTESNDTFQSQTDRKKT